MHKTPTIGFDNPYIIIKVEHLKFLYNRLRNELSFIRNRISKYYNNKRMKGPSFKNGGKVYLFCKNITTKRLNDKLDFKKFRSFIII